MVTYCVTKMITTSCVCVFNWPLPLGAFQDQCTQPMINKYSNIHRLRIQTGGRHTSWLFTSTAEKLKSGVTRATSPNGQKQDMNQGPTDFKSNALTTWPCCQELTNDWAVV